MGKEKESKKRGILNCHTLAFGIVLFALVAIGYMNALNTPFIMDDIWAIQDNQNLGDTSVIFERPLGFMRPLMIFISYTLGGHDPFFFHIFNVMFHFGTSVLLFFTIKQLLSEKYAWAASVLFAVHPILSEVVIWISALPSAQYSFFLMASLFSYIKNEKSGKRYWYYLSLLFCVLSVLSAEQAVALPLVIALLEISFFSLRTHWRRVVPYFIIAGGIAGFSLLNIGARIDSFQTNYYTKREFYNPLVHIPYSITSYLQLILFPKDLTIYHAEVAISWFMLALRWVGFIAFIACLIFAYRKSKPVFFWLSFFVVVLSPTLLPLNIVWMVAERYVYLAAMGIIVAVSYILVKIAEQKKYRSIVYTVIVVIAALLLMRTMARAMDWQSHDDFWVATVKTSPYSPNARNNMGYIYSTWGEQENAVAEYKAAVRLKPNYGDAYHNMALSYEKLNQYDNAFESYTQAIKYNPRLWQSHINIALIYNRAGKKDAAVDHVKKAMKYGAPIPESEALLHKITGQ